MNMSNLVGKLENLWTTLNSHISYLDKNEGESEIMERMDHYHKLVNAQVAAAENIASFEYLQDSIKRMIKKSQPKIGMSPSQYAKVIRINNAFKLKETSEKSTLTQIAYQLGYFDQSHFIKDFKSITNFTPKILNTADYLR